MSSTARPDHLERLLRACRYWLTEEPGDAPLGDPEDWADFGRFAYFHDLDPLLHQLSGVDELAWERRLPPRLRGQWEAAYYRNFVYNTELLDRLAPILEGAARAGLPLRVFKGPITATRGWLDPALRVMADVDLLCRQPDLPQLTAIAGDFGFQPEEQTASHHVALRHRSLPAALELHYRLYEVFDEPEDFLDELWAEEASVEVDGRTLPALTPELAVVLDVAHLLHHDLQLNLKPLLDLSATLWRQRDSIDWTRLQALLERTDLEPEFCSLRALLSHTLGLPAPGETPVNPPDPALSEPLVARLLSPDRLHELGPMSGPHRRGTWRDTLGYAWSRLVPPLDQLRATSGTTSRAGALAALPRHVRQTLGRAIRRWRRSTPALEGASLKATLFERRAAQLRR